MIVDASAPVALVRDEPGADRFFRALSDTREPKRISAIKPFETSGREQFRIQPTPIRISPAAALPFVMTINELCTNASKHGALTVPNGRVNIATKVNEPGGTFHFKWSEKGGPLVGDPSRRRFGMFLIERGFAEQFSGSTRMQFKPSGVVCEIDVPLTAIQQIST
jgi:two-component sensor histidine kinase